MKQENIKPKLEDKKLMQKIKSAEILSDYYGSDHCPIMIEI